MNFRLQKIFSQLAFICRKNYNYCQATRACAQKFPLCSLGVSRIEEDGNDDEFDEDYIYDYPTYLIDEYTSPETHLSICEIMQEMEIYSQFHFNLIPNRLKPADWEKLLLLKDVPSCTREREYQHLTVKEKVHELKKKRVEMLKSEKKKNEFEITSFTTSDVVPYRMSRNSIFGFRNAIKFTKMGEELLLLKKSLFGPHIIIDCSYESHMIDKELNSCARQILMLRLANKQAFNPFNIIHCNVHIDGPLFQKLQNLLPDLLNPAYVFHYTEKNFSDLFPREKLIYLSPHAVTELETYDHDAVYVIGALVDLLPKDNLSTERAQLNGIQSVRFPLDKYSNWCKGTKSLMLYQVTNILYDLKEGKSWEQTLSRNIQHFKTTFSGLYWREKFNSTDSLSVSHLKYLNFVDHLAISNKKL